MCRLRVHSIFFGLYTSSSSIRVLTLFICLHFFVVFFSPFLSTSVSILIDLCVCAVNPIHPREKKKVVVVYIEFFGLENSTRTEKKIHEKKWSIKTKTKTTTKAHFGCKAPHNFSLKWHEIDFELCNPIPQYLINVEVCIRAGRMCV